jgi:hypothetical protein
MGCMAAYRRAVNGVYGCVEASSEWGVWLRRGEQ